MNRGLVVVGAALVLALSGMIAVPPALAQDAAPITIGPATDANTLPWSVNCVSQPASGELVCNMAQQLIANDTGQRMLAASVFRPAPSASAVMRLSLPHGILLQQGVDVWVDDAAPTKHPIVIADQNGSYAEIELGADMLVALQGGSILRAGVSTGNGERVLFQLSLRGFTAAFANL